MCTFFIFLYFHRARPPSCKYCPEKRWDPMTRYRSGDDQPDCTGNVDLDNHHIFDMTEISPVI